MVRLILFIQVCAGEERGGLAAHGGNFSSRLVYFKDSNSLLLVMVRCPEDDFSSEHRSERPAPVEQSPPESLSSLFPPKAVRAPFENVSTRSPVYKNKNSSCDRSWGGGGEPGPRALAPHQTVPGGGAQTPAGGCAADLNPSRVASRGRRGVARRKRGSLLPSN